MGTVRTWVIIGYSPQTFETFRKLVARHAGRDVADRVEFGRLGLMPTNRIPTDPSRCRAIEVKTEIDTCGEGPARLSYARSARNGGPIYAVVSDKDNYGEQQGVFVMKDPTQVELTDQERGQAILFLTSMYLGKSILQKDKESPQRRLPAMHRTGRLPRVKSTTPVEKVTG